MAQTKPKYLLIEHGRYFYQRKVPLEFQALIGRKKWRAPLGGDFDLAYDRLRELRTEHDSLLTRLADPVEQRDFKTSKRRKAEIKDNARVIAEDAAYEKWCHANGLKTEIELYFEHHGEDDEPPWEKVERWLAALEFERTADKTPTEDDIDGVRDLLARLAHSGEETEFKIELPPFEAYKLLVQSADEPIRSQITFALSLPVKMDDDEYHDRLCDVYESHFGKRATVPGNPEDRDEFDSTKMKLERRIARVARDPNTLMKVAQDFYIFANLRPKTEDKYRRTLSRLIVETGDIPIAQHTPKMLREYRNKLQARGLLPSSIRAEFTPVMGLFNYAFDEELIDVNPMASVRLPKERRAVEEMKWLPFDINEARRISTALQEIWGRPVQGLKKERRQALQMAVRVLSYTAMRPSEFMALRPDQVDDRAIRVEGGKTKSSWRVIPLHPKIADFPIWLHAGGLSAFHNTETGEVQTDPVTSLRYNFIRLIRKKMLPPITHERKALYSLRSTFQNSMRRAGAPKDVRKAILGHVEQGAFRHYDDGPEFDELQKWVFASDPTIG